MGNSVDNIHAYAFYIVYCFFYPIYVSVYGAWEWERHAPPTFTSPLYVIFINAAACSEEDHASAVAHDSIPTPTLQLHSPYTLYSTSFTVCHTSFQSQAQQMGAWIQCKIQTESCGYPITVWPEQFIVFKRQNIFSSLASEKEYKCKALICIPDLPKSTNFYCFICIKWEHFGL